MILEISQLDSFAKQLAEDEKSLATISKYIRDVRKLFEFSNSNCEIEKRDLLEFKEYLTKRYKASSVNSILVAVNQFLKSLGSGELQVKLMKIQEKAFAEEEKELTREEYYRLVETAQAEENYRLSYLIQTIGSTGIRVSEVQYITVEAARKGKAAVRCKAKTRTIMIPDALSKQLLSYAREQGIESGYIFRTRNGNPMDRSNIWKEMKALCEKAGVPKSKVFPHNLRHLFATIFYDMKKDLVKLADVLGHSQIETTRIYTKTSGREHKEQINAMNLVACNWKEEKISRRQNRKKKRKKR